MHRYRAPSIAPGTFFVAQSWADFIINMFESNLRQAQVEMRQKSENQKPQRSADQRLSRSTVSRGRRNHLHKYIRFCHRQRTALSATDKRRAICCGIELCTRGMSG